MNDIAEAFNILAAALDQQAAWLEDQLAGRQQSATVLVHQTIKDYRYLASVARVDTGTEAATP